MGGFQTHHFLTTFNAIVQGLTYSDNEAFKIAPFPTVKKIEKETKEYSSDTVEIGYFAVVQ